MLTDEQYPNFDAFKGDVVQYIYRITDTQLTSPATHDTTGIANDRSPSPYPAYKPSGIDWLGDIPAHWDVRRIKTLFW